MLHAKTHINQILWMGFVDAPVGGAGQTTRIDNAYRNLLAINYSISTNDNNGNRIVDGVLQMIIGMLAIVFTIVAVAGIVNRLHAKSNVGYEEYRQELARVQVGTFKKNDDRVWIDL